jgi:hypothetical protein
MVGFHGTTRSFTTSIRRVFLVLGLACIAALGVAQTPGDQPAVATGVIKLSVKAKVGDALKGLARKRFFLIKGSLAENKNLTQAIEQRPHVSRDCYYREIGASEALIRWLKDNNCESVYCGEADEKDIEGPEAVPEFQRAVAAGEKEFQNRDLARKWLTVNLPENIRTGYYRRRQQEIQAIINQSDETSRTKAMSGMTDRRGFAYFTDVVPGKYIISNLVPTEIGGKSFIWSCDVELKADEVAEEKTFSIPNRKAGACVIVEKPLPPCKP